jgi:hypothetical protein
MPETEVVRRARRDKRQGKAPSTQAGEFVRREIEHIREGKHGARSTKQAIAIGLSEARRAGVDLAPPASGSTSAKTRKAATRAHTVGQGAVSRPRRKKSAKRVKASANALKREPRDVASSAALSRQAGAAANRRSAQARSQSAKKGARTRASQTAPA